MRNFDLHKHKLRFYSETEFVKNIVRVISRSIPIHFITESDFNSSELIYSVKVRVKHKMSSCDLHTQTASLLSQCGYFPFHYPARQFTIESDLTGLQRLQQLWLVRVCYNVCGHQFMGNANHIILHGVAGWCLMSWGPRCHSQHMLMCPLHETPPPPPCKLTPYPCEHDLCNLIDTKK